MNSPFPAEQARHLAGRPEVAASRRPLSRFRRLYRLALGRTPGADELQLALHFLEAGNAEHASTDRPDLPTLPGSTASANTIEAKQRLVSFQPFSVFVSADQQFASLFQVFPAFNEIWQTGHRLPDPVAGDGPSDRPRRRARDGPRHAVVRRWVAPADATVRITGSLTHKIGRKYGAGIRAWIVSSRHRQLAAWSLLNKSTETELLGVKVRAGDTIDFIVDCRGNAVRRRIHLVAVAPYALTTTTRTDKDSGPTGTRQTDFRGPPAPLLSPWEQLALVLLQTDELVFID